MTKIPMSLGFLLCCSLASAASFQDESVQKPETITFKAADGLQVSADLYLAHPGKERPFIVLFHQAGWSRGEYHEIAPRLNQLGYNCLAVDQRSGGEVNGVKNATHAAAQAAGLSSEYPDALPDMLAALEYARSKHARGKLLAWGSSYSAALVLKLAGTHPKALDGVLSFSPGEYFARLGKSTTWIKETSGSIRCPAFITSARQERSAWLSIFESIPGEQKSCFLPETKGNHGSRALWREFPDSAAYWKAVEGFLATHFPVPKSEG